MLERLARFVIHHRRLVVGAWIVLTIFGAYSAQKVNKRWLDQFSVPGYSAYETNQRFETRCAEKAPNTVSTIHAPITARLRRTIRWASRASTGGRIKALIV